VRVRVRVRVRVLQLALNPSCVPQRFLYSNRVSDLSSFGCYSYGKSIRNNYCYN